jgi:PUA-domain protein
MSKKHRRYSLKSKQTKQLLAEISERLQINMEAIFGPKPNVEIAKLSFGNIYFINNKPLFFNIEKKVVPTLFFQDFITKSSKIVVNMGAIPYICNGANVMAPGIVRVEGEFSKGDLVLVVDEKYEKPIAIGESLYDSASIRNTKHGALIKNVHFVTDKIWNFAKMFV